MSAKVEWRGLVEFRQALHNLPADLADEAQGIVTSHAQEAERLVQQAYPVGPGNPRKGYQGGNLKAGVRMTQQHTRLGARATVRSGAPHAHIFEDGTRRRSYKGADRGVMPKAPDNQRMIPIVVRVRRRMYLQLITMLQKAGFQVTSEGL